MDKEVLKKISESYTKVGNINKAFEYYKDYTKARDSANILINQENNLKAATVATLDFDYKKQVEFERLEKEKQAEINKEEKKRQTIIIFSIGGGLLFVIIFAGYVFRSLRVTRKQKKIIEEQKKTVEEKNKDILDSIRYAQRIQKNILPTDKYIDKSLRRLRKTN